MVCYARINQIFKMNFRNGFTDIQPITLTDLYVFNNVFLNK